MTDSTFPIAGAAADPQRQPAVAASRQLVTLPATAVAPAGKELTVAELWRIISKWRWLIAAAAVAGVAVAVAITLMTTPIYRGTASLEISSQPTQIVNVGELQPAPTRDLDYMATQNGLLASRSLAERVVRQLNLANDPAFVGQDGAREDREAAAIGKTMENFTVEGIRNSRLVEISYDDPDPVLAARVVNGFADGFIASKLERRYETTAYAREFLERRLGVVKARLETSERQLVDYARRQGIVLIGGNDGTDTRGEGGGGGSLDSASLLALNQELSAAQGARITAEQRYRQAQRAGATTEVLASPTVQLLRQRRAELEAQYEENLNVFQPDYPAMVRLRARIESLGQDLQRESNDVAGSLRAEYAAAVARENSLRSQVGRLKNSVLDLRSRSIQYNILQREVDTNRTLYDGLLQRFKEVGVAGGIGENLVSVVDRASVPGAPVRPILWLNILIGLITGLAIAIAGVFGIEFVDDTIATVDDVQEKLKITPLGVIPRVPKGDNFVELLADSRSGVTEAYSSVRTTLQFATSHGMPEVLLVTSSRAAEGKSSTSLALAQNYARGNKRVLLIDADLRKPTFRTRSSTVFGLSNLLTGDPDLKAAIHKTSSENLFILPSGHVPPNPADLLTGPVMSNIVEKLREDFDLIVIDGPPVLGLADAPLLSSVVDATLIVVESGGIRRPIALNTISRLRAADAKIVGAVLTKYSERFGHAGYGYGYGYGGSAYSYGHTREESKMIDVAA